MARTREEKAVAAIADAVSRVDYIPSSLATKLLIHITDPQAQKNLVDTLVYYLKRYREIAHNKNLSHAHIDISDRIPADLTDPNK